MSRARITDEEFSALVKMVGALVAQSHRDQAAIHQLETQVRMLRRDVNDTIVHVQALLDRSR